MDIFDRKKLLRKEIVAKKKEYSTEDLVIKSQKVITRLESLQNFKSSKVILAYNSMPDEVSTKEFINKWKDKKELYLPVITETGMIFRHFTSQTETYISDYGIEEPLGKDFVELESVDMIIVPGVAFDSQLNRMGRGKAYYDSFLKNTKATKVAICFDFQLVKTVPTDDNDIPMDYILSESAKISK